MKESPLQMRLNVFSQSVNQLETCHGESYSDFNLIRQLIRSATSVSLNYAEACVAASKRDFIHKARLSLKEIRESKENLSVLATSEKYVLKILHYH
jgi:four helix bundle protein